MARVAKNKLLSGAISNLVFRNVDGVQVVQSLPGKIKQTSNTKQSGNEFRSCSTWAKMARQNLYSFLMQQTDSYMYRRFTGALYNAIMSNSNMLKGTRTPLNSDTSGMVGFDFNSHSPFRESFLPELEVRLNEDRQVEVILPQLCTKEALVYPKRFHSAELLVYVVASSLRYSVAKEEAHTLFELNYATTTQPAVTWTSPVLAEGQWVIVTAKLLFYRTEKFVEKDYLNSASFCPSTILLSAHT